jgi:hypothetical protein
MPLRTSLFLLAILLSVPAPCARATPSPVRFVFTGAVTQPGGRPIPGARVGLDGVPGATATTDGEGRYSLACVVPGVTADASRLLVLRATHRGWNLALPPGGASLAIELRRVAAGGNDARIEVRANDADAAKAVARALAAGGGAVVALDARFTRLVGREDRSAPVLTALEVVTLDPEAEEPAPAPPAPAAAPAIPPERPESLRLFPGAPAGRPVARDTIPAPAPPPVARDTIPAAAPPVVTPAPPVPPGLAAPAPAPAVADTAVRPGFRVSVRPEAPAPEPGPLRVALGRAVPDPDPGPRGARVPPARGPRDTTSDCGCRVSGTVEVRADRPVRGRPRVVVSLAGLPAPNDTVAIFMGPPRSFDLGRVPCGWRHLDVRTLGSRRLVRVAPDSSGFACSAGGARQFRVVLEPR